MRGASFAEWIAHRVPRIVFSALCFASRVPCAVPSASRIASFAPCFLLRAARIALPASRILHPAPLCKITETDSKPLTRLR